VDSETDSSSSDEVRLSIRNTAITLRFPTLTATAVRVDLFANNLDFQLRTSAKSDEQEDFSLLTRVDWLRKCSRS